MDLENIVFWDDYPKISEMLGEEVTLGDPLNKELTDEVLGLSEDEYLVVYGREIIPKEFYGAKEFMTKGPDLKIRKVDKTPFKHFEEQLSRYNPRRPKRGFKWTNDKNNTSIFISISSSIDGAKLFCREKDEMKMGGKDRKAWFSVPSRSEEKKHDVFLDPLPQVHGKNWHEFFADCSCKEHLYYKHSSQYANPECYICPHIISAYHKSIVNFSEIDDDPIPLLFPLPSEKMISFDENLARTFIRRDSSRDRLYKGEREFLHSLRQGYYGNELNYDTKWFNL